MSKAKAEGPSGDRQTPTFEESLAALEQSVRRLEDGELDLAGALSAFESGIRHLKCCYALLEEAERRIELLCGVDANGQARVAPMTDEGDSLEEKQQARSRRRTHSPSPHSPSSLAPAPDGENVDGDGRLF